MRLLMRMPLLIGALATLAAAGAASGQTPAQNAGASGQAAQASGQSAAGAQVPRWTAYAEVAKLPDWSGVWQPDWSQLFEGRGARNVEPKLQPAAAKAFAEFKAAQAKGMNLQTQAANCMPVGMPQIMRAPYPIEFIFSPGRVTIAIETYSQVRRIYTDGRPLPEDPDPAFNGHSVGRWEGDTLVVDTVGVNPIVNIVEGVHPSEQMRIRERFRLERPDLMVVETTITDPVVLAEPFTMKTAYVRKPDWEIREYVCQENNRDAADEFGRPSMRLD